MVIKLHENNEIINFVELFSVIDIMLRPKTNLLVKSVKAWLKAPQPLHD